MRRVEADHAEFQISRRDRPNGENEEERGQAIHASKKTDPDLYLNKKASVTGRRHAGSTLTCLLL
jgi:hypothetical protein